jgi:predicted nucleotidyltransferase
MFMQSHIPTPFPEVNAILQELLESIQDILEEHFIGMYLEGSLANGDFDEDSDIDFVVVTDVEVTETLFSALRRMHERIATIDSLWAVQLEGSYISRQALQRYDPANDVHPNLERGWGEHLKMTRHEEVWNVHRYILRERGITILGPAPRTLIDPLTSNDLKQAMFPALTGWGTRLINHPEAIRHRGYQSYVVLTLCRILYTLQFGEVTSKLKSASWAKETTGRRWESLIDRAWEGRHHSQMQADKEDIHQTLDFIRYAFERGQQIKLSDVG